LAPATPPSHRRTLRCLLVVAVALAVVGALAPAAPAGTFTPQSGGSPNADRIDSLYKVALWIALVIFFAVEGALLYSLLRFRARRGALAAQIRGHSRLELGWTVGAALILVGLAALTFAKLDAIRNPPNSGPGGAQLAGQRVLFASADRRLPPNGKSLNIQVNGQQYVWRFTYPGAGPTGFGGPYSYHEMVVPTDTTVTLDVVSQDVVHSWWIPQLGGKVDATPGYVNHTWFQIHEPGLYAGECAELCGRNHADMIAVVRAVPPPRFEAWLAKRQADIEAANRAAQAARAKLASQSGGVGQGR
jgi:cytochrome c oxidase subunit 2